MLDQDKYETDYYKDKIKSLSVYELEALLAKQEGLQRQTIANKDELKSAIFVFSEITLKLNDSEKNAIKSFPKGYFLSHGILDSAYNYFNLTSRTL